MSIRTLLFGVVLALAGCHDHGPELITDPSGCSNPSCDNIDLSVNTPDGRACRHDGDCGSRDYLCAFKIADGCAAAGHCMPVATPTCASVVQLCGCDGTLVNSGPCFYANGYAGGPTTGATSCTVDGGGGSDAGK